MSRLRVGLLGTAIFAVSGAMALAQGGAAGGWYLKGFGGMSAPPDKTVDFSVGSTSVQGDGRFGTGYLLGGAVGYVINPSLQVEAELAYRHAGVSSVDPFADGGEVKSTAFMLNGYYMFEGLGPNQAWQPYVGAGLGVAKLDFDLDDGVLEGDYGGNGLLAYQLIGGLGYNLNQAWTLTTEVRWFATEKRNLDGPSDVDAKFEYQTVDWLFGAIYHF